MIVTIFRSKTETFDQFELVMVELTVEFSCIKRNLYLSVRKWRNISQPNFWGKETYYHAHMKFGVFLSSSFGMKIQESWQCEIAKLIYTQHIE